VAFPLTKDFYRLPRPVQDRFAAASRGTAPPPPLLFHPASRALAWILLGASALVTGVAVLVLTAGMGDGKSSLALHGAGMLFVDVLLFGAAAYAAVHALALLRRLDGLPFRTGRYLFPGCVVDAVAPVLRVWPVAEVESTRKVSGPQPALVLRLRDGSEVSVPARKAEAVDRADAALASLKSELLRAVAEEDQHALAEMDPLHDIALSSPVGPTGPMKLSWPAWVKFDWAIAAALGAVLGLGIGTTRNDFSDDAMFRAATTQGTVEAYQEYLTHAGRNSSDVRDILLPRAQLAQVEASGTVESLQAFAQAHASSRIGSEIDAAIRRALLAQLAEAKKVGTVTAIDAFVKKYPDSKLDPEIKAARHALYAAALDSWQQKTKPDAATSAFFGRLLAWSERRGPECELRFRLARSKIDEADQSVMKNPRYPGPDFLPSKYIVPAAMHAREQRVAADLVKSFADAFPADILAIKAGAPVDEGAPVPPAKEPTLLVDYVVEWSHVNNLSTKPASVFAGMNFTFDATFTLPAGEPAGPPWEVKVKSFRGPEPWKVKGDTMTREEFQQKVYDGIIDGAFDHFEKKATDALL
jgi:hypothetical protein